MITTILRTTGRRVATVALLGVLLAFSGGEVRAQESGALSGQEAEVVEEERTEARRTDRPAIRPGVLKGSIEIDGRIAEGAWEAAPVATGFRQSEPVEGIPAEHDTEVRVLVGEDALYIAARMYDPQPSAIGTQLVRRDERGAFDWFAVSLDPNRDRLTGYTFQVSAAGVQTDKYLFDDEREDRNWDAVWESAVEVDSLGWTAELRIPLSQIRYESGSEPQTWGVNFTRERLATNEVSQFALASRLREGRVSQFGRLEEVPVPEPSRRIEVRPYLLASLHDGPAERGDPFFDGQEMSGRLGGDLRVGLGSSFTLDATFNPDFGQVEADPAVINLSAFETFFEERRPFFVEDAQVFDFDLGGRRNQLFYSRRIGRTPHGRAPSGADFADIPTAATIAGAAKLTGRTSGGLSVGVLTAVTTEESGRAFDIGENTFQDFRVEPRTEYGVIRAQQDFRGGRSRIGGIFTALNRDIGEGGTFGFLPGEAFSGGLDFEHQWSDRTWRLSGFFAASHVRGSPEAMVRIQRSSNHFYQRPDATRLSVDSTATSLTGAQWRASLSKQNGRHWTGSLWFGEQTSGFEVNDIGFSTESERIDAGLHVNYREIEPGRVFRSYSLSLFSFHDWSHEALDDAFSADSWGAAYLSGRYNVSARGTFNNYWGADINFGLSPDTRSFDGTRGGPVMEDPGNWSVRAEINTDRRKDVSYEAGVSWRSGFDDSGHGFSVSGEISMRPSSRIEIELEPRWSVERDAAQFVTTTSALPFTPTFGTRYFFGDLERESLSMETRLNWTFSPTLSLQLFAQPLISSGNFVSYRQLAAARTFDFVDFEEGELATGPGDALRCVGGSICRDGDTQRVDLDGDGDVDFSFADRDFNVRSLVGNAVLRWEYRPGSTIFLVWQRNQSDRADVGDFELGRDIGELFGAEADNRFILKVSYWLGL